MPVAPAFGEKGRFVAKVLCAKFCNLWSGRVSNTVKYGLGPPSAPSEMLCLEELLSLERQGGAMRNMLLF